MAYTDDPKNHPVSIEVYQRGFSYERTGVAQTGDEIAGGYGLNWIDISGFDPDGNPVTIRTSAILSATFEAASGDVANPTVKLPFIGPFAVHYLVRDGDALVPVDGPTVANPRRRTIGYQDMVPSDEWEAPEVDVVTDCETGPDDLIGA